MSRLLVALVASAAVVAGAVWFVSTLQSERSQLAPTVAVAPPPSAPEREVAPLAGPPELAPAAPAVESPAPFERAAARTTDEEQLARAQWVEGRVVFPPGTPPDEELFVTADGRDFDDGSDHRVRVEGDGRFRVAFSEKSRTGELELEARYLFLDRPLRWKRGDAPAVTLEPRLGGRLEVQLVLPAAVTADGLGGKVTLLRSVSQRGLSYLRPFVDRPVRDSSAVAFDALEPEREITLAYDGARLVSDPLAVLAQPGRTLTLDLALRPGLVVAGRVLDEEGRPLAGVDVNANVSGGSQMHSHRYARSAEDGSYRLDALEPGSVSVRARHEGYEPLEQTREPSADGEPLAIDFVLRRGRSIAGTVRWPDGAPAEAQLVLSPVTDGESGSNHESVRARAAADGRFAVSGLTAAAYHVRAAATQVIEVPDVSAVTGLARTRKERATWSVELERVAVGASDLELVLGPGLAVRGVVRDERGAPLDDVRVTSLRTSFPSRRWEPHAGPSGRFRNSDGSFELRGFQQGTWTLRASARDRVESDPVEVRLPGAGPVELVLTREAVVRGVVLDTAGAAAARARVHVVQPDRAESPIRVFGEETGERSDDEGAFAIDGLHGGRAILSVEAADGTPGESLEVELVAGETLADVVLRLQRACTLECEAVDRHGRPVAGLQVHVQVRERDHYAQLTTDAQGRCTSRGLPEGSAWLFAENDEGLALTAQVELRAGEVARARLAPAAGRPVRLHGRVLAAGEPLAGVQVGAEREDASWDDPGSHVSATRETDAQGAYELRLPGSGRWLLSVYGTDSVDNWSVPVDVPDVEALQRDVEIRVGRVAGRVRGADGAPLAQVWVNSEPQRHDGGPRGSSSTRTDAEGRYELVLPVGRHALVAGGDRGPWSDAPREWCPARIDELVVAEGERHAGVDFTLQRGGTLAGVVRGPTGSPLAHAAVLVGDDAALRSAGGTESHGGFRIEGLAPGTHWLRAIHERAATPTALSVAIRAGEETRIELALVPAVMARVRVLDAAGAPLGSEIEACDADGRPVPQHSAGEQGSLRLGPLTPGTYRITARREDKRVERTLEVTALEDEIELVLTFD